MYRQMITAFRRAMGTKNAAELGASAENTSAHPPPPGALPEKPAQVTSASLAQQDKVGDFWSETLNDESQVFSSDVYWLSIPAVNERYRRLSTGGKLDKYHNWIEYSLGEFLPGRLPVDNVLSIGCGLGSLERNLALHYNAFRHCDAYDISEGAIASARELAEADGVTSINYQVQDVSAFDFPVDYYDAIYFSGSLHHIEPLESFCERLVRTLKPDGYLFFDEYIGPSRFNFPPRQKEVLIRVNELIPRRFRKLPPPNPGYRDFPPIPNPDAVRAADPSEAVRSADIMKVLPTYFNILAYNPIGGALLQYELSNIAHNFTGDDPDAMRVLQMLFKIEDTLMDVGDLQSDFAVVVARPKK